MTRVELRATVSLAGIFAMRLLGLFMIYPVFIGYARRLTDATPELIGLALGAYGLAQGLLQIPFGLLSDRIGRKSMISIGLVLFGAGSVVAALATSIEGLLLGRILQGTGAVGSVVLAMIADLTREEVRTRAMAIVGMTIGLSFVVAIILGPVFAGIIGVPGIFWFTAFLALLGIIITQGAVPTPARVVRHRDVETVPELIGRVLRDRELLRLDFSIFALHVILTASFLALPGMLAGTLHLTNGGAWKAYLPVLAASVILMVPVIIVAEKAGRMKEIFIGTIGVLAAAQLALTVRGGNAIILVLALISFFAAFNVMEALLPSLVTKTAPADAKGTATGLYSSSQFLGIFVGGAVGGWAAAEAGTQGVFAFGAAVALVWLAIAATMHRPSRYSTYLARVISFQPQAIDELTAKLVAAPGVIEAIVEPDEGVAYLKIDRAMFDADAIARITGA